MPPVTTSLAPVIAALDSKESGVTKVIHRGQSLRQGAVGRACRQTLGRSQQEQLDCIRTLRDFIHLWAERRSKVGGEGREEFPDAGERMEQAASASLCSSLAASCEPSKGDHKLVVGKVTRPSEDLPNSGLPTC